MCTDKGAAKTNVEPPDTVWSLTIITFLVLHLPGMFGSWVSIVSHGGIMGTTPGPAPVSSPLWSRLTPSTFKSRKFSLVGVGAS